jgi:mannose/fructose/sorbose-specific phosphotransferase system IIB component
MDIQLIRIDDRLIHGQVVVGWSKALTIERLVVVNDAIAKNAMQKTLMEMAVPAGLKVQFLTVEEAATQSRSADKVRSLLLFSNPMDLLDYQKKGGPLTSVNVGGMHFCEGKRQVSKTVCVNNDEVTAFKELKALGVEFEVRAVPGDMKEPLEKYLPEIKGS